MTIQVPYLSHEAIELDARALLAEYARARSVTVKAPIPIEDIVEKHLKLRIEFDDLHKVLNVPQAGRDPDIFGAIWVAKREIWIDQSLDPEEHPELEGRYRFTISHEAGGHWRLHRRYLATDPAQASLFGGPFKPAVVCRSSQKKERAEWQADFYASCLLMPRWLVADAWKQQFGTQNPIVYELVKHTPQAIRPRGNGPRHIALFLADILEPHAYLFDNVAKRFAPIFGVSVQAMRIRLEHLGLLHREVPRQQDAVGS
jgi:Zn-dependent peptidase ImmA (M78 family)